MTKRELSRLYYSKKEIKLQEMRIKELETKAASCTSQISGMPSGSGISDKVGNNAAQIADLKTLLEIDHQKLKLEEKILERYIQSVDDPLIRLIMRYRFAECCGWDEVENKIRGNNTSESLRKKLYRYLRNN